VYQLSEIVKAQQVHHKTSKELGLCDGSDQHSHVCPLIPRDAHTNTDVTHWGGGGARLLKGQDYGACPVDNDNIYVAFR
jgi:hypothetical protein